MAGSEQDLDENGREEPVAWASPTLVATMRRPLVTGSARLALRAACLLTIVVGIVGMHGLANHGVGGTDLMPHAMLTPSASPAMVASGDHAPALNLVHATATAMVNAMGTSVAPVARAEMDMGGTDMGGMDMGMAGLCVAMLVIGLGLVLWYLRGRAPLGVLWVLPRPAPAIARAGRQPDPPSLRALSIQRC